MASISHVSQAIDEPQLQAHLLSLSESWIVLDVKSQEWGDIYDKAHRVEHPKQPSPPPIIAIPGVSARLVALEFARGLCRYLDETTMAEIARRNKKYVAEGTPQVCATHEFCDPNVIMAEAMERLGIPDGGMPHNVLYETLWNDAWNVARAADFKPHLLTGVSTDDAS
jgi:hypothetical protein